MTLGFVDIVTISDLGKSGCSGVKGPTPVGVD